MWRFFNGLARGLRARTPAPPSQTSPWSEDNENTVTVSISGPQGDNVAKSVLPEQCQTPTSYQSFESEKEISQRILGVPSEADIILREYFGPNWKNKNTDGGASGDCEDIPDHMLARVGLGMTAIFLGRAVFSFWRTYDRKHQIFHDGVPHWHEFDHQCISERPDNPPSPRPMKRNNFLSARLQILPQSIGHSNVLAAGSDTAEIKTFEVGSSKSYRINPVQNSSKSYHIDPVQNDSMSGIAESEIPLRQKSVTFDTRYGEESESSTSSSISEEAIGNIAESTKDCSGATYNILGLQSVRSGEYKEAFHRFQLGAHEGYPKALFNLGLCYEKGLGTRKDITKAIDAYQKAAYKGHSMAQYNLALIFLGKGGIANNVEAVRLLEKASLNGLLQAQSFLGVYLTKPGRFQDFKKAVKMFKMAAEQGDASSKYHLGICYERALGGLKQDLSKAFDLYSSAASANHLDAQYQLAMMLASGFPGKAKNPELAQELLKSTAKLGHGPSNRLLKENEISINGAVKLKDGNCSGMDVQLRHRRHGEAISIDVTQFSVQSSHNGGNKEAKQHFQRNTDRAGANIIPDILSRHIFNPNMMNDLLTPQYNPPNGSLPNARPDFDPLSKAPDFSDKMPDLLYLPRASTTPANLCHHLAAAKDSANSFSLQL